MNQTAICVVTAISYHGLTLALGPVMNRHSRAIESAVGLVNASVTVLFAAYTIAFYDPLFHPLTFDHYSKPYPYSSITFGVALGFFLWHTQFYLFPRDGTYHWDMIIHSLLCLWTYGIVAFSDVMHRPAMIALFYEFSTLFLNTIDILKHYQLNHLTLLF